MQAIVSAISLLEGVVSFVQVHKPYFELAQAFSSVVNLFAWLLALLLLVLALRRNRIESLSVGPFGFRMMKAGLDHLKLFQNVREAVLASTGRGQQPPWESNGVNSLRRFDGGSKDQTEYESTVRCTPELRTRMLRVRKGSP
jgi:hypothetical protein